MPVIDTIAALSGRTVKRTFCLNWVIAANGSDKKVISVIEIRQPGFVFIMSTSDGNLFILSVKWEGLKL